MFPIINFVTKAWSEWLYNSLMREIFIYATYILGAIKASRKGITDELTFLINKRFDGLNGKVVDLAQTNERRFDELNAQIANLTRMLESCCKSDHMQRSGAELQLPPMPPPPDLSGVPAQSDK